MHAGLLAAVSVFVIAAACLLRAWYVLWYGKTSALRDPEWMVWLGAGITLGAVDLMIWLALLVCWVLTLSRGVGS